MKNYFIKFSLLFSSIFILLAIMEIFLRLLGWGQIVAHLPNEQWGYLMKPSQTFYSYSFPVHINKFGLRGPEIKDKKRAGVLRILFLGDSITYGGAMIEEKNIFVRIVESSLRNIDKVQAESINISAVGWSPENWIRYINHNGFFEADIIVMTLPENDLTQGFSSRVGHKYSINPPFFRVHSVLWKLYLVVKKKFGF